MHILCSVPGLTDLGRGIAASYVYLEKCFPMCSWAANEVTRGPFSLRADLILESLPAVHVHSTPAIGPNLQNQPQRAESTKTDSHVHGSFV